MLFRSYEKIGKKILISSLGDRSGSGYSRLGGYCNGAGLCVEACPHDVLRLNREVNSRGYHYSYMENPEECIGCANCGVVCPDACIAVYRMKVEYGITK